MKWAHFVALLFSLAITTAARAQMTPQQCTELARMIRQTEANARQAEGASSQQSYINQAAEQYRALYNSQCQ